MRDQLVKVYSSNGDLVAEYKGRFHIETDYKTYINLYDYSSANKYTIYFSTFNILIDEIRDDGLRVRE